MSHVAQVSSGGPLAQKIRRLEDINKTIEDLCSERDNLQYEITILQAERSLARTIPVEIWGHIFEEVILSDSRGNICRHIACLMEVCKLFNEIMVNSPQFWRTIYIGASSDDQAGSTLSWVRKQKRTLPVFLSRSKSLSLDIIIDLGSLASPREVISNQIMLAFGRFKEEKERPFSFWEEWECSGWDDCEDRYQENIVQIIQLIVGENEEHIARWRSLELFLPGHDGLRDAIWVTICGFAPQLRTITLDASSKVTFGPNGRQNLAFPSVTSLTLYNAFSLHTAPLCKNIISLTMLLGEICAWERIEILNQFSKLQQLHISTSQVDERQHSPLEIKLPKLRELHLESWPPQNFLQAFRLTELSKLTLVRLWGGRGSTLPPMRFLSVAKSVIYLDRPKVLRNLEHEKKMAAWQGRPPVLGDAAEEEEKEKNRLRVTFQNLFSQLSSAQTLSVNELALEVALEVAMACRAGGGLPALRSIRSVRKGSYDIVEISQTSFPV